MQTEQLMIMILYAQDTGGSLHINQIETFQDKKFVSSVLVVATKNNGIDYSGMLLCILFGLVSRRGQTILTSRGMTIVMANK